MNDKIRLLSKAKSFIVTFNRYRKASLNANAIAIFYLALPMEKENPYQLFNSKILEDWKKKRCKIHQAG